MSKWWFSKVESSLNPLADMPVLGSSNSAVNKDRMSKMWMNGDTIIGLQCFQKLSVVDALKQVSME